MQHKDQTNVPNLRNKNGVGNNRTSRSGPVVDQLDDEVLGIPPSLTIGLLTGLFGAAAGGISLVLYFYLREPDHFVSPEWLNFLAFSTIVGIFLRIERGLFGQLYLVKTQPSRKTRHSSGPD